ncbi:lamina-associated polypeptide 2-like [Scyliorhinus canicula]|uniref:lamina-associated polypeptide 2-like n=1 Tax=Scyliorhinus canicula TaxID=7830 RepID=UPI0018F555E2|nr:lamina-associated polypeptide 2-like [Scyliorhinus canicula]
MTRNTDKAIAEERDIMDVTELSDEDLKEQLIKHGFSAGPIVATTRKVYEKKLEQLMDQGSVTEENQPNGSTDSDQYSDTEEEILSENKELFTSKTKTPVITRRRQTEYSWVEQKEAMKDNLLEEMFPNQAPTPTGISATCRRPIRGAAGRPIEFMFKDALPRRSFPQSSASDAGQTRKEYESRSVSIWMQIVVLLIVAFFLFLVYQAMETNKRNPFPFIPADPSKSTADSHQ